MKTFVQLRENLWSKSFDHFAAPAKAKPVKLKAFKFQATIDQIADYLGRDFRSKNFNKNLIVAELDQDDMAGGVTVVYRDARQGEPMGRKYYSPQNFAKLVMTVFADQLPKNIKTASFDLKKNTYFFTFNYAK